MTMHHEPIQLYAPAKVNLSLRVTGRRADGYHMLSSLVCFTDIADQIFLHLDTDTQRDIINITGPFADALCQTLDAASEPEEAPKDEKPKRRRTRKKVEPAAVEAEAPASEAAPELAPTPEPKPEPSPAPVVASAEADAPPAEPDKPRRRGWWSMGRS